VPFGYVKEKLAFVEKPPASIVTGYTELLYVVVPLG
jgi:hypothetical protein